MPLQPLFDLNPAIDRAALAETFARDRRVQIRNVLTEASADAIHEVLERHTDWGLGWHAGDGGSNAIRGNVLRAMAPAARAELAGRPHVTAAAGEFAFVYGRYPMLDAYREGWHPGHPLDLLLEHINAPPLLDLVRAVTGDQALLKADAQATVFAPGHFLTSHEDINVAEVYRVDAMIEPVRHRADA